VCHSNPQFLLQIRLHTRGQFRLIIHQGEKEIHSPDLCGGVTVGDASYCPSPAAGMGGSVAILGAAALGDALGKHPGDLKAAFQAYDESFRPIVEVIQTEAVEFGLEMFLPRSEEAIQERNVRLSIR